MAQESGPPLARFEEGDGVPPDRERDARESGARTNVQERLPGGEQAGSQGRFEGVPGEVLVRQAPDEPGGGAPARELREVAGDLWQVSVAGETELRSDLREPGEQALGRRPSF